MWNYTIVTGLAIVCYFNTLFGTFVFDDTEAIIKNKDVLPTTPLSEIFRNDFWGTNISLNSSHKSYRPLTILTFRLNVLFNDSDFNAVHFHTVNVLLYVVLCLLTIPSFRIALCNTCDLPRVVLLSSVLFTVHPLHTEAVAGLVGRADLLSSILTLLSLLLYHKLLKENSVVLFLIVNATMMMAVLFKETAITSFALCAMYDILHTKVLGRRLTRNVWKNFTYRFTGLTCFILLTLYFRFYIMNFVGPTFSEVDNPAAFSDSSLTRVLTYNYIYFINLLLMVWPQWLCFDWSMGCIPLLKSTCDIKIVFVILLWTIVFTVFVKGIKIFIDNKISKGLIFSISLLIIPFIPASNLFLKVGFVIAERNLLLPSAGYCLIVAIGYTKLARKYSSCRKVGFFVTCFVFLARTIQRNFDWLTEENLFMSALQVCPLNAKVHYNIAKVAADANNKNLALVEYTEAIRLNPNYEQAMNNLANLLREDKKFAEAEVYLRKALEIRPNFAAAWMNLGIVLTNLNVTDEAEKCYLKAISYRKKYPDCYYNLGNLYLDLHRNVDALKAWDKAIKYKPTHTAAWSNTLVLLDSMRLYQEAIKLGRTALMHNPKSPALHFSIANTLGKLQRFEMAEKHFMEALNLNPHNALYYSNLGVLYHRWGKHDKAKVMYKKALQLDPTMITTEVNLKKLQNAQGSDIV